MVANDVSVLEPSWATPPSIMDDRAWGAWRWHAGVAAGVAMVPLITGLLTIVKEFAGLVK